VGLAFKKIVSELIMSGAHFCVHVNRLGGPPL
jgi:hypothetical protein